VAWNKLGCFKHQAQGKLAYKATHASKHTYVEQSYEEFLYKGMRFVVSCVMCLSLKHASLLILTAI
jgi:hypothetical protein